MMRMLRKAPWLIVVLLMIACAPQVGRTRVPAPASPLGCWRFAFTPWTPPLAEDIYPLPLVLELTDYVQFGDFRLARRHESLPEIAIIKLPASMIAGVRRLSGDSLWMPDSIVPSRDLQAFWEPRAGDSVAVVLPTFPMTGIRLDLRLRGDSLVGTGLVHVDVKDAPRPSSEVRALRVTCPAG